MAAVLALGLSACQLSSNKPVNESPARSSIDIVESDIGQTFNWGGEILKTSNLKNSTELTILGYPLDMDGEPEYDETSTGRFIAVYSGFLEPTDFRKGVLVSVTGSLKEIRQGMVAKADYQFPVLSIVNIDLHNRKSRGFNLPFSIGVGIGI